MVELNKNIKAFTIIEVLVALIILVSSFTAAGVLLSKRDKEIESFHIKLAKEKLDFHLKDFFNRSLPIGNEKWSDDRFTFTVDSDYFGESRDLILIHANAYDQTHNPLISRTFVQKMNAR